MQATTISFRAAPEFVEQTRSMASVVGLRSSDYIREAVREKNERVSSERIAQLSRELASEHLALNEAIDDSVSDGLA